MIKCNRGELEFKGGPIALKAEFATIVHVMRFEVIQKIEPDKDPEEAVMDLVRSALMTEEELDKEMREKSGGLLKNILKGILKELEEDDD